MASATGSARPARASRRNTSWWTRAAQPNLSAPEMTVLVGGLRVLGANSGGSAAGVLTDRVGELTNDFFVNLVDIDTIWKGTATDGEPSDTFEGSNGEKSWTGTRADLVFGSNAELRALAEEYAADDAADKFVADFVKAWVKVMKLIASTCTAEV